jgi:FtsH-binding integral membrane protein
MTKGDFNGGGPIQMGVVGLVVVNVVNIAFSYSD